MVQIVKSNIVLTSVSPTTGLLRTAVVSIPDSGFVKNPKERRKALLNKIEALDAQLTVGDLTGARNKLQNDIRKQLVDWLVANYQTSSPREYTKEAILQLVDNLLARLGG